MEKTMSESHNLDTVRQAIEIAQRVGAKEAEAFLQRSRVLTVQVGSGEVETVKQAEDIGIAVRALVNGRMGMAYGTDLDSVALERTAAQAVQVARASDPDEFAGLSEPDNITPLDTYDPEMERHSADEKIERALAIERAAKAFDARIVLAQRITYSEQSSRIAIANTRGLAAAQSLSRCDGMAAVIARQGDEQQVGDGWDTKLRYADFDTKAVGEQAAEHAVSLLGARVAETMRASILLEPKMTGAFIGIIAFLVCADNVQKGKSLLAGKIGQTVAAAGVTLVDDGACPDAPARRAWDDEGVRSRRTPVITDGVLQGYLHSTYTARKAKTRSTGNARRPFFKLPPVVAPSNVVLVPGKETPEDLRWGIARGLWVTSLMNLHTANPISGEFSFGANGLWIENGNLAGPVCGVSISGNLVDLLKNVRGVANNLQWDTWMGFSMGAPTILIEDVSIAGR